MGAWWKELLMGLAVSLLGTFLISVSACVWKLMRERISRPAAGGEVRAVEVELDIVAVNGDGGQIAPRNLSCDSDSDNSSSTRCTGKYGDYDHHDEDGLIEHKVSIDGA